LGQSIEQQDVALIGYSFGIGKNFPENGLNENQEILIGWKNRKSNISYSINLRFLINTGVALDFSYHPLQKTLTRWQPYLTIGGSIPNLVIWPGVGLDYFSSPTFAWNFHAFTPNAFLLNNSYTCGIGFKWFLTLGKITD
jgi:hypothetical protein